MESPSYARHAFSSQLQQLEHDVLDMGSRAESMIGMAVDALSRLDMPLAFTVLKRDDEVDARDLEIETGCLRLLALQQPTGPDLRTVGTVMKIITDIERVGDLAVDIAKTAMKIDKEMGSSTVVDIPKIANVARSMFRTALEAFVKRDLDLVQQVAEREEEVDAMYRILRGQIHANMRENPEQVVADSWLLLAIHHIERIADHTVNIAERVQFMVTGKLEQIVPHDLHEEI
jgi:phosphate transport system protein